MVKRILLLVSTVCTLIVTASFVMFALEEAHAGTSTEQNKVAGIDQPDPSTQVEHQRARKHTKARELIDDANDFLTKPFDGITTSNDIWTQRGIPFVLALLLYFVVLRVIAGYAVRLRL